MSSILRALKKLEEDSLSPDQAVNVPRRKMKQVVSRRARPPRVLRWVVAMGMLAVLVMAGAVLRDFLGTKADKKPVPGSTPVPVQSSSPGEDISLTKPGTVSGTQPAPLVHGEQEKEARAVSIVPADTGVLAKPGMTGPAAEDAVRAVGRTGSAAEPVVPASGARTGSTGSPLSRPGHFARPGLNKESTAPPAGEQAATKKTMHPELILNGVLWSDNPERRVALINNRYLREGESIDGVSLVKIEKKAVTLQSGSEKWTITVKK